MIRVERAEAEKNKIEVVFFRRHMDGFLLIVFDSRLFALKTHFEGFYFCCCRCCLSLCLDVSEIFPSAVPANSAEVLLLLGDCSQPSGRIFP